MEKTIMALKKTGEIQLQSNGAVCKNQTHQSSVRRSIKKMPTAEGVERLSLTYRMLSEPLRLKIVLALMNGELCVQHILEVTTASQSSTSHQLRVLKDNGIVKCRREGQNVFYALVDGHIHDIIALGVKHLACKGEEDE